MCMVKMKVVALAVTMVMAVLPSVVKAMLVVSLKLVFVGAVSFI